MAAMLRKSSISCVTCTRTEEGNKQRALTSQYQKKHTLLKKFMSAAVGGTAAERARLRVKLLGQGEEGRQPFLEPKLVGMVSTARCSSLKSYWLQPRKAPPENDRRHPVRREAMNRWLLTSKAILGLAVLGASSWPGSGPQ